MRRSTLSRALFVAVLLVLLMPSVFAWYNTSWQYRKNITINASEVNASHANFPLLIRISDDGSLAAYAQADGDDILFTNASEAKLDHEIEYYNSTSGDLIAWVRMANLSNESNTVISMYYGNSGVSSQQNRTAVWNANFKGVWHLAGNPLNATDATSFGNNGTVNGVGVIKGRIDGAGNFSGDTVRMQNYSSLNITANLTVCAWVFSTSAGVARSTITTDATADAKMQYAFSIENTGLVSLYWSTDGVSFPNLMGSTVLDFGNWYYLCAVRNSSDAGSIFINGLRDSTTVTSGTIPTRPFSNRTIGDTVTGDSSWNGWIDEVQISNVSRSAQWIRTSYNNQRGGQTFLLLGRQECQYACSGLPDWIYRRNITINASQVNGTQWNFPVLVRFANDTNLSAGAQQDGDDIIFTNTSFSILDHEIEYYNGTSGALAAWVRVPVLQNATNTTLYMYYGNGVVSAQENPTGVWDRDYAGVWHLGDNYSTESDAYRDSTSRQDHGVMTDEDGGGFRKKGIIGMATKFNGSAYYQGIYIDDVDFPTGGFTISAWVNFTQTYEGCVIQKGIPGYSNYYICVNDDTPLGFSAGLHDGIWVFTSHPPALNDGNWHYAVASINTSAIILYVDGIRRNVSSAHDNSLTLNDMSLGIGVGPLSGYDFAGDIDEARVSSVNRSHQWIWTEYNNQKNGSTFIAVGREEKPYCDPVYGQPWIVIANHSCTITGFNTTVSNWTILGSGNVSISNSNITYIRKEFMNLTGRISIILANNVIMRATN